MSIISFNRDGGLLRGMVREWSQQHHQKCHRTWFLFVSGNPKLCTGNSCKSRRSKTGLVAGLISAACAVLLIVVAVLTLFYFKRKNGKHMESLLSRVCKAKEHAAFSYNEVRTITNNFKQRLGCGGFGPVYYGQLSNRQPVAVKILSEASHQGEREFLNEVNLLSRIHHKNLVTFLGYCVEENLVLIYEYMSNGSLFQALQGKCQMLSTWRSRLRVAIDSAEGLEYLHNGCNPEIIHRDVKSSNILIGQDMRGKLSDFGISRSKVCTTDATNMYTAVQGSFGYLDPEYAETQVVTHKIDVYAFGVVLFEICSGRSVLGQQSGEQSKSLVHWAKSQVERGDIQEVMDSTFNGVYDVYAAWKVIDIAMRCVEYESVKRPSMNEVCVELKSALSVELQGEKDSSPNPTFTLETEIAAR